MTQTTSERIIRHAIACIAQNGNAGLDEIAKAAGVGRATLYRHFRSRADLLAQIKLSAGIQFQKTVGPVFSSSMAARDKLAEIVSLMVPLGASLNVTSYFFKSMRNEADDRVLASYEQQMGQVRKLCQDLKTEGVVAADVPLAWLVASLTGLVFAAWEMVESGDIAPKQAPWLVLENFLAGHGSKETLTWLNELKEANL